MTNSKPLKPHEIVGGKPRPLTAKQEAFCVAMGAGMNQTEAYKSVYGVLPTTSLAKIAIQASTLIAKNQRIRNRIDELRMDKRPVVVDIGITLTSHLLRLEELGRKAEKDGKWGDAIKAEIARGKAAGIIIERQEVTGKDGGVIQTEMKVSRQMSREEIMLELSARGLPCSILINRSDDED